MRGGGGHPPAPEAQAHPRRGVRGRLRHLRLSPLHVQPPLHHVDPAAKSFGISVAYGKSLAAFREEATKCVLVCANCHGEIETGMVQSPPAGAKFGEWSPRAA